MVTSSRVEWRVPAYLPYLQPPLTDIAVKDAERRLGLRLPDAYLTALREQNGGYLRYGIRGFEIADQFWGIGPRFPSILAGSVKQRCGDDGGWLPHDAEHLVPFAGDGHWYMCMDVRDGRTEPAVTYIDLESRRHKPVADTFAELVMMLTPADDDLPIGVATDASLGEAAKKLAKVLGMKVTDQGDSAHGYPTFHGGAKGAGAAAQFWLSPNEVSRGFVRKEDPDYKKRCVSTSLRQRAREFTVAIL